MRRRHLVIFAKAPRLGRVKRRLARDIGSVEALRFYRVNLLRTVRRLGRDARWTTTLAVTPDSAAGPHFGGLCDVPCRPQGGGDIGARMARALRAFGAAPVVIVGSDVPELEPQHMDAAFKALARYDAVFGPAVDGGYWLVGWSGRRPLPWSAFQGVAWSTPTALSESRDTLGPRASVALIDELSDIDDAADYIRWHASGTRRARGL